MEQSDALRKAQGLLNLASDPSCTDMLRTTYQDKAFDLIESYGIDQAMLNAKADVKQKPTRMKFEIFGAQAKYRVFALNSIAAALHCHCVNHNSGSYYQRNVRAVTVFGFESDLTILEMLWTSLQLQGFQEVAQIKGEIKVVADFGSGSRWIEDDELTYTKKISTKRKRNAFWQGFGYKIARRLEAAEKRLSTAGTDLVLYDRSKQVEDAKAEAFPQLGKAMENKIADKAGFYEGMDAGERANIYDKAEVKNTQRELT